MLLVVHVPPLAIMPISDFRRLFKEGDTIRVISGFQKGRKGSIIHVDGLVLTFLDLENRPRTEVVACSGQRSILPPSQVRNPICICENMTHLTFVHQLSVYSFEGEFCSIEI